MKKKIIIIVFAVFMAAIFSFVAYDAYRGHQRKLALEEQLVKIEEIRKAQQAEQDRKNEEYREQIAKWQSEVLKVEKQNKEKIARWERKVARTIDPVIVDGRVFERITEVQETVRVPNEIQTPEGEYTPAPAPPPVAAVYAPIDAPVERQIIETPKLQSLPPPPAVPVSTSIEISAADGIRIELDQSTSWNTILQLIFTLLASYLGIKLINKHVKE